MTLLGTLSPTLTFKLKMQTWLEVRNQLAAAGFLPRTKGQLKRKWEDLSQPLKTNTPNERRLGMMQ